MAEHAHVHFSGDWRDADRAVVVDAIEAYEAAHELPTPPLSLGKPWIAVAHRRSDIGSYFFARRVGVKHTFSVRSVEALARMIRAESA